MLKKFFQTQFGLSKKCQMSVRSIFETKSLLQSTPSPPKSASNNSALYKLRKSTGYGMSKCKDALEKNNNNIEDVKN